MKIPENFFSCCSCALGTGLPGLNGWGSSEEEAKFNAYIAEKNSEHCNALLKKVTEIGLDQIQTDMEMTEKAYEVAKKLVAGEDALEDMVSLDIYFMFKDLIKRVMQDDKPDQPSLLEEKSREEIDAENEEFFQRVWQKYGDIASLIEETNPSEMFGEIELKYYPESPKNLVNLIKEVVERIKGGSATIPDKQLYVSEVCYLIGKGVLKEENIDE